LSASLEAPSLRETERGARGGQKAKRDSLSRKTFGEREAKKLRTGKKAKEKMWVLEKDLRRVVSVNEFRPQRFLAMQGPGKR